MSSLMVFCLIQKPAYIQLIEMHGSLCLFLVHYLSHTKTLIKHMSLL